MRRVTFLLRWLAIAGLLAASLAPIPNVYADSISERRARIGIKLFRSMLTADEGLEKKVGEDGRLTVFLVYSDDRKGAKELAEVLGVEEDDPTTTIKKLPARFEFVSEEEMGRIGEQRVAGVFITQRLHDQALDALVRYGIEHNMIVYSPFEGHVERGVLGGLSIEAKVRPYVNKSTLDASGVAIKSFFLKVAKLYE